MSSPPPTSFDDFAASYDRRDELNGGFLTGWLRSVLVGHRGSSALDLGCGTGRVATVMADHFDRVVAVDVSEEMICLASAKHHNPRVTYVQGDLMNVTGRFDLVVSIMVLHHLPDLARALDHIANLVTEGGLALVVDAAEPNKPKWKWHARNALSLAWDLRARDRNAWEKFWLNSDPRWIDHLAHDRFLSPEDFVAVYSKAFPGAVIGPLGGLYTVAWERRPSLGSTCVAR